jgi:hypothetical protein
VVAVAVAAAVAAEQAVAVARRNRSSPRPSSSNSSNHNRRVLLGSRVRRSLRASVRPGSPAKRVNRVNRARKPKVKLRSGRVVGAVASAVASDVVVAAEVGAVRVAGAGRRRPRIDGSRTLIDAVDRCTAVAER